MNNLIFEERTNLDSFGVNEQGTLNKMIYEQWLLKRGELLEPREYLGSNNKVQYYTYEEKLLMVFNEAYYVCTKLLMHPCTEYSFVDNHFHYIFTPHSVVVPLIRFYLMRVGLKIDYLSNLVTVLGTMIGGHDDWQNNYNELIEVTQNCVGSFTLKEFVPRKLTLDVLSEINWISHTDGYNVDTTRSLLNDVAKNEEEWRMMVDSIKIDLEKYEKEHEKCNRWDWDPFPYTVPSDLRPYYEFLDDIRDRFNERPEEMKQVLLSYLDGADVIPSVRTTPPVKEKQQPLDDCFRHCSDFVKAEVKKIVDKFWEPQKDMDGNLAFIEIVLYENNQLRNRNKHLKFIDKLIDWGIIPKMEKEEKTKIVNNVRYNYSKAPSGDYQSWPNETPCKDVCESIEAELDESMRKKRS